MSVRIAGRWRSTCASFRGDSMNSLSRSLQVFCLMIALAATTSMPGVAGKESQGHANLRHARPLHGHNPVHNGTESGDDDTAMAPLLNALCQSYLGVPNPYANPTPNVDQIVG